MDPTMKFVNVSRTDFFAVLKSRVDNYFAESQRSRFGDYRMVLKTLAMLSMLYVPYVLVLGELVPGWAMFCLAVVMGVGVAGIGMSVMHDANHNAYSSVRWVNRLLGYTINLVGGNAHTWKMQHNVLHHTYTNIEHMDEDINTNMFLVFTPSRKRYVFHKFQHTYAFFFYGLLTFNWFVTKDFVQFFKYQKRGLGGLSTYAAIREFLILSSTKILYFTYMLVIPLIVMDAAWWQIVLGFLMMQFTTGLILSVIFQLAHVVEGTDQPLPNEEGNIENEWAIHQLHTTANFARRNKILSWYIGGLNYQIEHHLFHGICHIHYPALSEIVQRTAAEFQVPYIEYRSFFSALRSHVQILKKLGHGEPLVPQPTT
ncbi:MAG: acyl-CoA desaturase [Bacteroidetes bacterium]|nr:acyl-CoA desaturase [Bacteroidota bacterium]